MTLCNYQSSTNNLTEEMHLFIWTDATEIAFQTLKQALINAPVLALPNFAVPFTIETDVCDVGIGAIFVGERAT
jgi:hypothetical protein